MMNVFRKALGCLVAAVLGVSIGIPAAFTANAEDNSSELRYHPCDVNHDGNVSIIDAICVNFYLNGDEGALHPEYLDTNGNNIVDVADFQKIMATLVEDSYSWSFVDITASASISESSNDSAETQSNEGVTDLSIDPNYISTSITRGYYRFRYTPTPTVSTYSLTTTYDSNSKDSTLNRFDYYTSVGPSETGIVQVGNGSFYGTGFIIDDHRIVTCAHCVYADTDNNYVATSDEFFPNLKIRICNANGELTDTYYDVKEIHIPINRVAIGVADRNMYDYALITVSETLSSNNYTHFNLGTPINVLSTGFRNINLFISGFPGDASTSGRVNTSKGNGTDRSSVNFIDHDAHVNGGFSGGPIYTATRYKIGDGDWETIYSAVAIQSIKYKNVDGGFGPAFNDLLLTFYHQDSTNVGY